MQSNNSNPPPKSSKLGLTRLQEWLEVDGCGLAGNKELANQGRIETSQNNSFDDSSKFQDGSGEEIIK